MSYHSPLLRQQVPFSQVPISPRLRVASPHSPSGARRPPASAAIITIDEDMSPGGRICSTKTARLLEIATIAPPPPIGQPLPAPGVEELGYPEEHASAGFVRANAEASARRMDVLGKDSHSEELRRMLPEEDSDEVLCLDVGGRSFHVLASTLRLFGGSLLAKMLHRSWAQKARGKDGNIFLDIDPDCFEEILNFLRRARMYPAGKVRSSFSAKSAEVAMYLGIPVHHIKGGHDQVAHFPCIDSDARSPGNRSRGNEGFAFDVQLPHPQRGVITSLQFRCTGSAKLTVYTKSGSYKDSLSRPDDWTVNFSGHVKKDNNKLPVSILLDHGEPSGIYLNFSDTVFEYSSYAVEAAGPLVCTSGRSLGASFQWPPSFSEYHLLSENRFFAGDIVYTSFQE